MIGIWHVRRLELYEGGFGDSHLRERRLEESSDYQVWQRVDRLESLDSLGGFHV